MEKAKKEFEEYRMELIYLNGDIITTSGPHESVDDGGDLGGSGDPEWPEEPGIE